ncbi:hypothetical protein UFOVP75_45 [uncultured Caudovirales phage]|uniref:Uncharacterized protein n=1 Tax=uncultured Caudovirales phage TaxID=2100421 RepID=A0A6J5L0X6_9CAUD|nr:hypothetical protein UFOVP75_45 [uncultured Caudovirales phage]
MSNDKVSKLIVGADVTDLARAKPIIDAAVKSLRGLNEAQGNGSKSGVAGQGNAQGIIASTAAAQNKAATGLLNGLKLMGNANKQLMAGIASDVHNQTEKIKKDIASLDQAIKANIANYERLKAVKTPLNEKMASLNISEAGALAVHREKMVEFLGIHEQGAQQLQQALRPSLGSRGGFAGAPPSDDDVADEREKRRNRAKQIVAGVAGVGSLVGGIADTYQTAKTMEIGNLAAIQQATTGRWIGNHARGDISDEFMLARRRSISGELHETGFLRDMLDEGGAFRGEGATKVGLGVEAGMSGLKGAGAFWDLIKSLSPNSGMSTAQSIGGMSSGVEGTLSPLTKWNLGKPQVMDAATAMEALDLTKQANPGTMFGLDLLRAEAPMQAAGARKLMGARNAYGARSAGTEFGYSGSEAIAIAEGLQERVGARSQGGLLRPSMEVARAGISMGAGQDALASIYSATGQSGAKAFEAVKNSIVMGMDRGFRDPRAQQEIVGAIADGARGAIMKDTSGLEAIASFMTGGVPMTKDASGKMVPADMSVADIQARRGAMQGLNDLYQTNPFFQGVRIANANNVLGRNAPINQLIAASSATDTELIAGNSLKMRLNDISPEKGRSIVSGDIAAAVVQASSMSPKLRAAIAKAGGIGHIKDLNIDDIEQGLSLTKQFGSSDQMIQASAQLFKSQDFTSKAGKENLKKYKDGIAEGLIGEQELTKLNFAAKMQAENLGPIIAAAIKEIPTTVAKIMEGEKMGQNLDLDKTKQYVVQIIREIPSGTAPPPAVVRGGKSIQRDTGGAAMHSKVADWGNMVNQTQTPGK